MTTDQLYKIYLHFPAVQIGQNSLRGPLSIEDARYLNSGAALDKLGDIYDYLEETGRRGHYVNIYDNTDDETGRGELIVVMSDRTTALLLKLALS